MAVWPMRKSVSAKGGNRRWRVGARHDNSGMGCYKWTFNSVKTSGIPGYFMC